MIQSAAAICRTELDGIGLQDSFFFATSPVEAAKHDLWTAAAAVTDTCSVEGRIKCKEHNVSAALELCCHACRRSVSVTATMHGERELVSLLATTACKGLYSIPCTLSSRCYYPGTSKTRSTVRAEDCEDV
jgi:hypothetical protein